MNREILVKEPDWILSCYSNWRRRGAAEIQPEKKSNFNKKRHFLKIRFGHVHLMFYPSSIKHFFQQPDNHAFFSVYSLPCLSLSLPSAKLKHHQICLWRKVQSNQFWEFSFRGASCEISRPQSSVGGRPSVQFKLLHSTFNAYFVKMNSERVNVCVTLYLCVHLLPTCAEEGQACMFMLVCWCNDCNMNSRIIHHVSQKTPQEARNKTITETPCTSSPPLHFNLMWTVKNYPQCQNMLHRLHQHLNIQ